MLYVSTRNAHDTFTAHHALHEFRAPDGGFYAPFYFSKFSDTELDDLKKQPASFAIAKALNIFFGLHLSSWDIDLVIGRMPFKIVTLKHRVHIAECWHNPGKSWDYLVSKLYQLITSQCHNNTMPCGWAYIAIDIALLFGLLSTNQEIMQKDFDIAIYGDFRDAIALMYAKELGFPFHLTILSCSEESMVWDIIKKGELNTALCVSDAKTNTIDIFDYVELLLFCKLGSAAVTQFLNCQGRKSVFYIDDMQKDVLSSCIFPTVVSTSRLDSLKSGLYQTNEYCVDANTALAFAGLLNYRAQSAISKDTIFLSKRLPI